MPRLRIFFWMIWSISIIGCTPLSNNRNEALLECGKGLDHSEYFLVEDENGARLSRSDFDFVNLDGSTASTNAVSEKGCVQLNNKYSFLLRNRNDDTGILVEPSKNLGKTVKLERSEPVMTDISCDPKVINTISADYRMEDLVTGNIDDRSKKTISLDFQFTDGSIPPSYFLLDEQKSKNSITSTMKDGIVYEVKVTVSNLMHRNAINSKICKFKKDTNAPDTILTVNSNPNFETVSWHGLGDIVLVRSEQSINFTSDSEDVKTIEYCAEKLDDNFSDLDIIKSNNWKRSVFQSGCQTFEKVELGQRFIPREKGFWSLNFRSIDKVGNISPIKKANLLLQSTSEIEFIKAFSKTKALNALSEKRLKDAIDEALSSESARSSLPTLFERNSIKNFTLSAMLTVLNNSTLPVELEGREEYGRNAKIGKISGKIYGMNRSNKVVIWNQDSHKIEREINIPEEANLDYIYISEDEKQLLAQHTYKVDLIDLESGKLVKTIFRSKGTPTEAHFTSDGKFIVVVYGDVIYTYDRITFAKLHVTELNLGNRSWPAQEFIPNTSLILVNDDSSNIKLFDFLTGELKDTIARPEMGKVSTIMSNPDGKSFYIGDVDGDLEKWSLETKTNVLFPRKHFSAVRGIQISNDLNSLLSFTSNGDINIWSTKDSSLTNTLSDFRSPLYSAEFNKDASEIVATAYESKPLLWKIKSSILIFDKTIENIDDHEFEWLDDNNLDISTAESNEYWTRRINLGSGEVENITSLNAYANLENSNEFIQPNSKLWCLKTFAVRGISSNICHEHKAKLQNASKSTKSLVYRIIPSETEGMAIVYDFIRDREIAKFQLPFDASTSTGILSEDGTRAFFETSEGFICVSTATGDIIWKNSDNKNVGSPFLSDDQKTIIVSDQKFHQYFYDSSTGKSLSELKWISSVYAGWIVDRLHINQNSGLLSFSNGGREISLWDLESKVQLLNFNAPKNQFTGSVSAMNKSATKVAYNMPSGNDSDSRNILVWDIDHDHAVQKLCSYVVNPAQYRACK